MKNTFIKEILIVLAILALALGIYTYKLNSLPNGIYVDEATNAYNAFSLLKTDKDEYGKTFPIAFRLFGSYSPPLQIYLLIPLIKFLDLNAFTVRLPSVMAMSLTVFLFYFSLKKLRDGSRPYWETLVFALLPWTVFFARVGYEVSLSLPFFALAFLLLLYIPKQKSLFLLLSLVLAISAYTSHTGRFLSPVYFLTSIIFYKNILQKNMSIFWGSLAIYIVLTSSILWLFLTPAFSTKNSLFYSLEIANRARKIFWLPTFLTWPLAFTKEFLARYIAYLSPKSLFHNPDPDPQRSMPFLAIYYPYLIIPYFVSLYLLLKDKLVPKMKLLLLITLISPIPAALAKDPFSTQRALPLFFPLSLIIFWGFGRIRERVKPIIFWPMAFFLLFFSLAQLYRSYFILLPQERAHAWCYGFEKLAQEIKNRPGTKFVIDQTRLKPAYIELAFFLKLDPTIIQNSVRPEIAQNYYRDTTFDSNYSFQGIETRNIEWEKDIYLDQIIVGDNLTVSENQAREHFLNKVFEIRDPVGTVIFVGYQTNPKQKCLNTNFESPYCQTKKLNLN